MAKTRRTLEQLIEGSSTYENCARVERWMLAHGNDRVEYLANFPDEVLMRLTEDGVVTQQDAERAQELRDAEPSSHGVPEDGIDPEGFPGT